MLCTCPYFHTLDLYVGETIAPSLGQKMTSPQRLDVACVGRSRYFGMTAGRECRDENGNGPPKTLAARTLSVIKPFRIVACAVRGMETTMVYEDPVLASFPLIRHHLPPHTLGHTLGQGKKTYHLLFGPHYMRQLASHCPLVCPRVCPLTEPGSNPFPFKAHPTLLLLPPYAAHCP